MTESPAPLPPDDFGLHVPGDMTGAEGATGSMKIIAVTNIKGGVGKTTTAVNLSYLCAVEGGATLLWDLDPQGAATYTLQGEPREHVSTKKLLSGKKPLPELIVSTAYPGLDLLPADFSYRNFDVHLSERKHPTERLLRMSAALRANYTTLFLDCAPGISLLSENVLRAADAIVVPLVPSPLSVRMLAQLRDFIVGQGWTDLQLLPFFSMVDRRRSLHGEVINATRAEFPMMLLTEVPYWSEIERMTLRRAPIPASSPHGPAANIYRALWKEVSARLVRTAACLLGALALVPLNPARATDAVTRFDGTWNTVVWCPNSNGALGFAYHFSSVIRNGQFHGKKGERKQPGWFELNGPVFKDGSANLYGEGLVGAAPFAVGQRPKGTPYGFLVMSTFADGAGTGSRVEGRPCSATFTRRFAKD